MKGFNMSILKFVYKNKRHDLYEMYNYLINPAKTSYDSFIGFNVNPVNPIPEMQLVQNYYHYPYRDNSYKTYQQVIFSFDNYIDGQFLPIRDICVEIGLALLGDEQRQIFASIHFFGTSSIHCHYMINYVDINGNLYRQKYSIYYYKTKINTILSKYRLPLIKIYSFEK